MPVGVRGRTVAGRTAAGGSQRPPSASGDPDGDRRGGGRSSEVAQPLRVFGAVSLFPGCRLTFAAVRVSTPRFRGCTCTGCRRVGCARRCRRWWARNAARGLSANVVSRPQAQLGRGVPVVVPAEPCRRLGIRLGGRHPQRPAGRGRTAVRTGGDWRERPRREALPGDRGWCSGVHPELARGIAGYEAARLHAPGEAGRRRRRAGLLVSAVGGVSADPGATLLDAQDRQRPQLSAEVQPAEGQAGPP